MTNSETAISARQEKSQSFFQQHGNQSFAPLLTEVEKRDLGETGIAFDVLKVRRTTTQKYGESWALDIDLSGTVRGMMFSRGKPSDTSRDDMLAALEGEIFHTGPITARLAITTTNNGNEFYYLDMPDTEAMQALESGDDDVPF